MRDACRGVGASNRHAAALSSCGVCCRSSWRIHVESGKSQKTIDETEDEVGDSQQLALSYLLTATAIALSEFHGSHHFVLVGL